MIAACFDGSNIDVCVAVQSDVKSASAALNELYGKC